MGRYFALTLDLESQKPRKKTKTKGTASIGPNFRLGILMLLLILGITYLMQANNISTQGYEIKDLEKRLSNLKETHKKLELESSSLESIQSIEGKVKALNYVPSKDVHYLGEDHNYAYQK